jgi:hypothetical protein
MGVSIETGVESWAGHVGVFGAQHGQFEAKGEVMIDQFRYGAVAGVHQWRAVAKHQPDVSKVPPS